MNKPLSFRKGAILLQTLVMAMLLSYISVMIMSWVLQRYTMAIRVYRKNVAMANATGFTMAQLARLNKNPATAPVGYTAYSPVMAENNQTVSVQLSGTGVTTIAQQDW